MEPHINMNSVEINARGEKQAEFNNLFLELKSLPGGDVEVNKKEVLYEKILTMLVDLVKQGIVSPDQQEGFAQKAQEVFEYSMMTEDEAKHAREQKRMELDAQYRSPGFKEE